MRVDLGNVGHSLSGEGGKRVGNVHFVLADDCHAAFAKQLVVLQQAAGYGVLDCHGCKETVVALEQREQVAERVARNGGYVVAGKIFSCCRVVEAPCYALYGYVEIHIMQYCDKNKSHLDGRD